MSLKDPSNLPEIGGESSPLQLMHKPSQLNSQTQASAPLTKQKTSELGWSTLSYLFAGALTVITVGGLIYIGYELTKPLKKSRPKEVTKGEDQGRINGTKKSLPNKVIKGGDQVGSNIKQGNEVKETIETPTPPTSDRHELVIERKLNQDIGITLCPGEDKQPGAFVVANIANEELGLQIGAQLVEINGSVLHSGMSFKDIVELLEKSCCPSGKLCFKKNRTLGERWKEAEAAKESGNVLFKNKEIDEAIKKYSTAIEKHPTNIFYWSNKASALYSKAKANPEIATEIYAEALVLCQTIQELDVLQNFKKGHHIRGVILSDLFRYDEAKNEFEAYLKIDNENKNVHDRLKECEKSIATAVSVKKRKDKQESGKIYVDVRKDCEIDMTMSYADMARSPVKQGEKESPSPVLVEKPAPTEIAELKSLDANEQQKVQIEKEAPKKKVIDKLTDTAPQNTEEKKEGTIKSADDGGNIPVKLGTD